MRATPRILALAGGVGGAKLAHGLAQVWPEAALTVVVNTGDDFTHWDLAICPDLDTVTYTLAGVVNPETGWGRQGETWSALGAVEQLGGESWFRLGDKDLATHLERTRRLRAGESLSAITRSFCRSLGVAADVVPMSDDPVRTLVETELGVLPFQTWFVKERCGPAFRAARFEGIDRARPNPTLVAALEDPDLAAVIICPSNPFVSIAPILALEGIRDRLVRCSAPRIAVTPIIGGAAVKGPAATMFTALGLQPSAVAVARQYQDVLDAFVLDTVDLGEVDDIEALGLRAHPTDTLMRNDADRARLAREVLGFAGHPTL